jgi:hypothetical protein
MNWSLMDSILLGEKVPLINGENILKTVIYNASSKLNFRYSAHAFSSK